MEESLNVYKYTYYSYSPTTLSLLSSQMTENELCCQAYLVESRIGVISISER